MSQRDFFKKSTKNEKNNFNNNIFLSENNNNKENNNISNIKNIKNKNIPFINNNPYRENKNGFLYNQNNSFETLNQLNYDKSKDFISKNNYQNLKFFTPPNSQLKYENIFKKINNQPLSKLKNNQKKKKEKKFIKTHFKGLESIYIKPKEIYDLFKKEDALRLEKLGYFNINEKKEKEQELIEKRNEYKSDIRELIKEEQNIQKIVNTKEFSELLGNNKYYKEAEYNDKSILNDWDEESKINYFSENEEEKNKKMNYLRKIAFEEKKVEKPRYQYQKVIPNNFIKKKKDTNKDEVDSEDDSFFEEMKRSKKKDNINILLEMEDQLRVEGKVYHMKNQMDKICKELLNKYKIHNVLKK